MSTDPDLKPLTIQDVDRLIRKHFLLRIIPFLILAVILGVVFIPFEIYLSHMFPKAFGWTQSGSWATATPLERFPFTRSDTDHVFSSMPVRMMNGFGALVVLWLFYLLIFQFSKKLIEFGRRFAETGEWENVANVLSSFNNFGNHFLDRTGEGHYLLSVALKKIGKPELSRIAKDYVLKKRPDSEWAEKLRSSNQPVSVRGSSPSGKTRKKSRIRR